jgi:hypothetical protein
MPQALIDAIELAVGVGCLALGVAARGRGLRTAGVVFGLAGVAAAGHAIWSAATSP